MKERLLSALREALRDAGLWRANACLVAAVSGGADSVCLLYLLSLARRDAGFRLEACHVQHGLRGESSQGDEAFVRELCQRLDVPLTVRQAHLRLSLHAPGVETAARERRRQLFMETMNALGADALLTGHHRDDQAETVVMRLLRGAGTQGLAGICPAAPFSRGVILRPLLPFGRDELQGVLTEAGLGWRHDETNDIADNPRNILRLQVLPQVEALFPGAGRHIAQAADCLREDERCLSALADTAYQAARLAFPGVHGLWTASLADVPTALRLRALRRFYREGLVLAELSPDERELSRTDSLALDGLLSARQGITHNLPCGLQALRGRRCLHLLRQDGAPLAAAPLPSPLSLSPPLGGQQCAYTFQGLRLEAAPAANPPGPYRPGERQVCLSGDVLRQCVLRTPRPGDVIQPLGAPGCKPLRRFLTDRKVDMPFRPYLPLLALKERVLWVPGLVTAEELRRTEGSGQWQITLIEPTANLPYCEKE